MDRSDCEAIGRGVISLGFAGFCIAVMVGSLWGLDDLRQSYDRGEVRDFADWLIVGWAGFVAMAVGGSAAYGLWRLVTGRFEGL